MKQFSITITSYDYAEIFDISQKEAEALIEKHIEADVEDFVITGAWHDIRQAIEIFHGTHFEATA